MKAEHRPPWWVTPPLGAGAWVVVQMALGAELVVATAGAAAFLVVGGLASYWRANRRRD